MAGNDTGKRDKNRGDLIDRKEDAMRVQAIEAKISTFGLHWDICWERELPKLLPILQFHIITSSTTALLL